MIDRALYRPQSWAADEERRRVGYVLAVTSSQRLWPGTVSDWVEEVPADGWHRLSAGDGAKAS